MNNDGELITKRQAAIILGISYPNKINLVIKRGELRTKDIGGSIRVVKRSIDEYLNCQTELTKNSKPKKIYALQHESMRPCVI